jgi:hypothetical protein
MADRNTPVTVLVGDNKHPSHLNEQQALRMLAVLSFRAHRRLQGDSRTGCATPSIMLPNGVSFRVVCSPTVFAVRSYPSSHRHIYYSSSWKGLTRLGHKCAPRNENTFISAEASGRVSPHWPPLVPATFAMEK